MGRCEGQISVVRFQLSDVSLPYATEEAAEKVEFGQVSSVIIAQGLNRLRKKASDGRFWTFQLGRG